jgi:hypothetical protein
LVKFEWILAIGAEPRIDNETDETSWPTIFPLRCNARQSAFKLEELVDNAGGHVEGENASVVGRYKSHLPRERRHLAASLEPDMM